jgi:hypothetical protein
VELGQKQGATHLFAILGEKDSGQPSLDGITVYSTANPVTTVAFGPKLLAHRVPIVQPIHKKKDNSDSLSLIHTGQCRRTLSCLWCKYFCGGKKIDIGLKNGTSC